MLVQAILMNYLPVYEAVLMHDANTNNPRQDELYMMEIHDVRELSEALLGGQVDRTLLLQYWVKLHDVFRWGFWRDEQLPDFIGPDPDDPYISIGPGQSEASVVRPEAEDRRKCQEIAVQKWKEKPGTRIAEMARDEDVRREGNGGLYGEATVVRWLREVAPLGVRGRRGRPRKRTEPKTE